MGERSRDQNFVVQVLSVVAEVDGSITPDQIAFELSERCGYEFGEALYDDVVKVLDCVRSQGRASCSQGVDGPEYVLLR